MRMKVNKDFLSEYKDEFWKGFSVPEMVSIGLGLGCIASVTYVTNKFMSLPPNFGVYIGIFMASPIFLSGFYLYQGYLSVVNLVKEFFFCSQCKFLYFSAGETKEERGRFFYMKIPKKRGEKSDYKSK